MNLSDEIPSDATQQPNPADAAATADAAKPNGETATEPTPADGQGNGETAAVADGEKPADGQGDKPEEGQPVAYEAFKLPDGFALEGERLDRAQAYFKSKDYTQEQAQEAVDLYCEFAGQDAASVTEATKQLVEQATEDARAQQIDAWGNESKQVFGDQYDATVEQARKAVAAVGRPELTEAFNKLGWGNHPELIRAFAHFGALLGESDIDTGERGQSDARPKTLEERMYANSPANNKP